MHGAADQYFLLKWRMETNKACLQEFTQESLARCFFALLPEVPLVLDEFQTLKGEEVGRGGFTHHSAASLPASIQ